MDVLANVAVHPFGTLACRLKVAAPQATLSLSVTIRVYVTGVPGLTHWLWAGDMVSVGLEGAQAGCVRLTVTPALVLFVHCVAIVTPAAGSVKLPFASNAGSCMGR